MDNMTFYNKLKKNKCIRSAFFSLKRLRGVNICKTIIINFKTQKWKDAVKFPILLYNNVKLTINGSIEIQGKKYLGKIRIGKNTDLFTSSRNSILIINGSIVFEGSFLASNGVTIVIDKYALLEIGDVVSLGGGAKIRCCNHIKIGTGTGIVEECQVFDSNFHNMMDINTNIVYPANGEIIIQDFCWIGNRTTISKGTRLPDFTIVASNSLVNKDFITHNEPYIVIGGIPAKMISKNKARIYDLIEERRLFNICRIDTINIQKSDYIFSKEMGLIWRRKTFNY